MTASESSHGNDDLGSWETKFRQRLRLLVRRVFSSDTSTPLNEKRPWLGKKKKKKEYREGKSAGKNRGERGFSGLATWWVLVGPYLKGKKKKKTGKRKEQKEWVDKDMRHVAKFDWPIWIFKSKHYTVPLDISQCFQNYTLTPNFLNFFQFNPYLFSFLPQILKNLQNGAKAKLHF